MLPSLRKVLGYLPMLVWSCSVSATPPHLSMGIVPQQAPAKLIALWSPLLEEISRTSGIRLQFQTAKSIPEFQKRLAQGHFDFAYMNPYHFVVFSESPGYRAMVKAKDSAIQGILVVHKDSAITGIEELAGKEIAFPAPEAFAATLLPQAQLKKTNIPYQAKYVNSHDSVYLSVSKGFFTAGGGIERTLHSISPEIQKQLRIIWISHGYTPHAIAAHPRVPQEKVERVRQALLDLSGSPSGQSMLAALKVTGWETAIDRDWDDVKQLTSHD